MTKNYGRVLAACCMTVLAMLGAHSAFSQVEAIMAFTVSNDTGDTDTLRFGFSTIATRCLDPWIGEKNLPPLTPDDQFDARFTGCLGGGLRMDIHPWKKLFPIDTFKVEVTSNQDPITVKWDTLSISPLIQSLVLVAGGSRVDMMSENQAVVFDVGYFRIIVSTMFLDHWVGPRIYDVFTREEKETSVRLCAVQEDSDFALTSWFEWGESTAYGNSTVRQVNPGAFVSAAITGLKAATQYHFRFVTKNETGTVFSDDRSVRTAEVTDVGPEKDALLPFSLGQNFPNPFNPTTVIWYQIPSESRVRIQMVNVLGQTVASVLDEIEPAGSNSVEWTATGLAGGVYYYILDAIGLDGKMAYREIKKALLVR